MITYRVSADTLIFIIKHKEKYFSIFKLGLEQVQKPIIISKFFVSSKLYTWSKTYKDFLSEFFLLLFFKFESR